MQILSSVLDGSSAIIGLTFKDENGLEVVPAADATF